MSFVGPQPKFCGPVFQCCPETGLKVRRCRRCSLGYRPKPLMVINKEEGIRSWIKHHEEFKRALKQKHKVNFSSLYCRWGKICLFDGKSRQGYNYFTFIFKHPGSEGMADQVPSGPVRPAAGPGERAWVQPGALDDAGHWGAKKVTLLPLLDQPYRIPLLTGTVFISPRNSFCSFLSLPKNLYFPPLDSKSTALSLFPCFFSSKLHTLTFLHKILIFIYFCCLLSSFFCHSLWGEGYSFALFRS